MGSILKWNVNNDFGLTLKSAVFKNILRQDVEFFDKKQVVYQYKSWRHR